MKFYSSVLFAVFNGSWLGKSIKWRTSGSVRVSMASHDKLDGPDYVMKFSIGQFMLCFISLTRRDQYQAQRDFLIAVKPRLWAGKLNWFQYNWFYTLSWDTIHLLKNNEHFLFRLGNQFCLIMPQVLIWQKKNIKSSKNKLLHLLVQYFTIKLVLPSLTMMPIEWDRHLAL